MGALPESVFHYTRTATLLNIVRSKEFWLSNVFFMNDFLEINWLFSIAQTIVRDESKKAITSTSFTSYSSPPGTSSASSSSSVSIPHGVFYRTLEDRLASVSFDHIYCGSFSRSKDDLSQWRGYADDGRGVALELDLNVVQEHNSASTIDWRKVCYDKHRQEDDVRHVVMGYAERIGKGGPISCEPDILAQLAHQSLSLMAAGCKNPKFATEREFRLIVRPNDGCVHDPTEYNTDTFKDFPGPVDFYERNGTLVPYTRITLPHGAIRGVTVGPRFGGGVENELALRFFLSKHGLDKNCVPVQRSEASYR